VLDEKGQLRGKKQAEKEPRTKPAKRWTLDEKGQLQGQQRKAKDESKNTRSKR
jgi:hypothetical protein